MKTAQVSFASTIKSLLSNMQMILQYVCVLFFENIKFCYKIQISRNDKSYKNVSCRHWENSCFWEGDKFYVMGLEQAWISKKLAIHRQNSKKILPKKDNVITTKMLEKMKEYQKYMVEQNQKIFLEKFRQNN